MRHPFYVTHFVKLMRLLTLLLFSLIPAQAAVFDLRFDKLTEALQILPDADTSSVNEVISLIKAGRNDDALKKLNMLNMGNPENSSLRVLTAYTLFQIGNLVGALQEADKAHEAPNGNSYKCWFYAKIALLTGNDTICRRELEHARKAGDMPAEVKTLEQEMKARKRKG